MVSKLKVMKRLPLSRRRVLIGSRAVNAVVIGHGNGFVGRGIIEAVHEVFWLAALQKIQRTALRLFVRAAEVFADDAKNQELHAAEEQDAGHDGWPAGRRALLNECLIKHVDEGKDTRDEAGHPEVKAEAQRERRARKDTVDGKTPHLARREFRNTGKARRGREMQLLLTEAHRADEPADEARVLAVAAKRQHGLAVHQAEVGAARLHRHLGDEVEEFIVAGRSRALEPRGVFRRVTDGLHDLIAVTPILEQCRDELGRMLHVTVHRDDDIAIRMVEAAGQRELMAVVAREQHRLDAAVLTFEAVQDFAAPVARAVVDKDNLPVKVLPRHGFPDGFVKMLQIILFVVDWHNDGQSLFLHA